MGEHTGLSGAWSGDGWPAIVGRAAFVVSVFIALVFIVAAHRNASSISTPPAASLPTVLARILFAIQMAACVAGWIARRALSGKLAFLVSLPLLMLSAQLSRPPFAPLLKGTLQSVQRPDGAAGIAAGRETTGRPYSGPANCESVKRYNKR